MSLVPRPMRHPFHSINCGDEIFTKMFALLKDVLLYVPSLKQDNNIEIRQVVATIYSTLNGYGAHEAPFESDTRLVRDMERATSVKIRCLMTTERAKPR
jgi:hypothetical protein